MHETDIFTSLGHWELISRWLESGGKWKPLSKHSMVFFLWVCSWRWSQSAMVPWDVCGCGAAPAQPGCCSAHSSWWICAFWAAQLWTPLMEQPMSAASAVPGGAAPAQSMESLGLTQPQDPAGWWMPGSWSHLEKGKGRANLRQWLPSTTPKPLPGTSQAWLTTPRFICCGDVHSFILPLKPDKPSSSSGQCCKDLPELFVFFFNSIFCLFLCVFWLVGWVLLVLFLFYF